MPYIITADPPLKILIDSGASSSIINPKIAFELFSKFIFPYDFEIKSLHKVTKGTHALTYPILRELGDDTPITFLIAEWNETYNCLIGHKDLRNLKAYIDYKNQVFGTAKFKTNYFNNIPEEIKTDHINNENEQKMILSFGNNTFNEDDPLSMIAQASTVTSPEAKEADEMLDDDMATIYTSDEDSVFALPVIERMIHSFDCSIILKLGNDYDVRTERNKLKTQYLVKIKEKDAETQLLKFLKENIKPEEQYGIYFEITTCKILENHFNKRLKLVKTNIHTPSIDRNNFEHVIELEAYVIENHKKRKKICPMIQAEHLKINKPSSNHVDNSVIKSHPILKNH